MGTENTENIDAVVRAKDQASPVLRKLQSNVNALGSKGRGPLGGLLGGIGAIGPGALAAGLGIGVLTGALADGVAGALEEEKQLVRLDQALQNNVKNVAQSREEIDRATQAAMDWAFSDDEARESIIKLIPATKNATLAIKDMRLAADIARGRNIDLAQATDIVIKATMGNVGALRRYGIEVKAGASAQAILNQLQATYAGQADAYAKTTAGKFESAQIKVNETMEGFGHHLITNTAGLLGWQEAMAGNKQAAVDYFRSVSNLTPGGHLWSPLVDILQAEVDKLPTIISRTLDKNVPTAAELLYNSLTRPGGMSPQEAWRAALYGFSGVGGSNSGITEIAEEIGADAGAAAGNAFADDLIGAIKGNKGAARDVMHDVLWALSHPGKADREVKRLQKFLNSEWLSKALNSNDPATRQIGLQAQQKLMELLGGITGAGSPPYDAGAAASTDYASGWNNNLPNLNNPVWPTYPGGSRPPRGIDGVLANGGPAESGHTYLVGERGPELLHMGRSRGHVQANGGTHVHVHLEGDARQLFRVVDEEMGRRLSRTPAGVVNRG